MAGELKILFTKRGKLAKFDEVMTLASDRPLVFGRSGSADVHFEESDVSGRHMEVRFESDGCYAVCMSKHGMKVNERKILHGESVKFGLDDEVMLGTQVRFRIKALPECSGATGAVWPDVDGETVALRDGGGAIATNPMDGATMQTSPVEEATMETRPLAEATIATRSLPEATMATRPIEEPTLATRPAGVSFERSAVMDGSPIGEGSSVDMETMPLDDCVTRDSEGGAADPCTMGDVPEGATIGIMDAGSTRPVDIDQIRMLDERRKASAKARQTLRVFLLLLVLVVSVAAVWLLSPKDGQPVNFRMENGRPDVESRRITDDDGRHILDVYYQRDGRMKKVEAAGTGVFSVETFTGRKGNVPYRLTFAARKNIKELTLSLAESFDAWKKERESREKIVFLDSAPGEVEGLFFEDYYGSQFCQQKSLHGMAFLSSEYTRTDGGAAWHGVALYFRNGDTAYGLRREIPERFWRRGKWLMRVNPNMAVYRAFNLDRWESPGAAKLKLNLSVPELLADAKSMLAANRISNWAELACTIDTLMVRTWRSNGEERETARKLLAEFRKRKDVQYKVLLNSFESHRQNGDSSGMASVFNECQSIFGSDDGDRRFSIFNNPEIWSCRRKR